jgi:cytochrome c-type biogenesis protein CcmH/NrfG
MSSYPDQIEQVDRDLAEVAAQVEAGEIDEATAERLRAGYERERASLLAAEAEMNDRPPPKRSPGRAIAGGALLTVGVVAIALFAIVSMRDDSPAEEVTDGIATDVLEGSGGVDLSEVTIEEMEAVVAANPSIIGMRLALAQRYVDAGDHSSALQHYLTVLDQEPNQPEALAMVGWLSYLAGEAELAEPFVEKALAVEPDYPLALWFLANIEVAIGDDDAAAKALEQLLAYDLPSDIRDEAELLLKETGS